MPEALFAGIDAGGSKTVCLVGDRQATLGRGEAGPANPSLGGVSGFRQAVAEAATRAVGAIDGPVASRPLSAWIGVAGGETPGMRAALRDAALVALDAREVWISHDARLILAAAGVQSGIAVVAGTGSSVYGLSADGREVTVGGWGHLLGDEGSGYDIARQALRAVTKAADGRGPRTRLSDAIPAAVGVASVSALRERLYPAPPVTEVARLARVVLDVSREDNVASAIVDDATGELAAAIQACRRRLGPGDSEMLPVVVAGGLMSDGSPLLARLARELEQLPDSYHLIPLRAEPAAGALALARDGPERQRPKRDEEVGMAEDRNIHQHTEEAI